MWRDVYSLAAQCSQCQLSKATPPRAHGRLRKVAIGSPLDIIAVDILFSLPVASDGGKYILVLTDYFTKLSDAYAFPDAYAPTLSCPRCITGSLHDSDCPANSIRTN